MKNEPDLKGYQWFIGYLIFGAVALFPIAMFLQSYIGFKQPGHFYESTGEYDARIYVMVYPDDNSSKNYYLPADISADNKYYSLNRFDWPNGGYADFSGTDCEVRLGEKTSCTAINSDVEVEYFIQLTDEIVE